MMSSHRKSNEVLVLLPLHAGEVPKRIHDLGWVMTAPSHSPACGGIRKGLSPATPDDGGAIIWPGGNSGAVAQSLFPRMRGIRRGVCAVFWPGGISDTQHDMGWDVALVMPLGFGWAGV